MGVCRLLIVLCLQLVASQVRAAADCSKCTTKQTEICAAAATLRQCYTSAASAALPVCTASPANSCQTAATTYICSGCPEDCFYLVSCISDMPSAIKWYEAAKTYWTSEACTTTCPSPSTGGDDGTTDDPADSKKKKTISWVVVAVIICACMAVVAVSVRCWGKFEMTKKVEAYLANRQAQRAQVANTRAFPPPTFGGPPRSVIAAYPSTYPPPPPPMATAPSMDLDSYASRLRMGQATGRPMGIQMSMQHKEADLDRLKQTQDHHYREYQRAMAEAQEKELEVQRMQQATSGFQARQPSYPQIDVRAPVNYTMQQAPMPSYAPQPQPQSQQPQRDGPRLPPASWASVSSLPREAFATRPVVDAQQVYMEFNPSQSGVYRAP